VGYQLTLMVSMAATSGCSGMDPSSEGEGWMIALY
jgi:hypothetical protein